MSILSLRVGLHPGLIPEAGSCPVVPQPPTVPSPSLSSVVGPARASWWPPATPPVIFHLAARRLPSELSVALESVSQMCVESRVKRQGSKTVTAKVTGHPPKDTMSHGFSSFQSESWSLDGVHRMSTKVGRFSVASSAPSHSSVCGTTLVSAWVRLGELCTLLFFGG